MKSAIATASTVIVDPDVQHSCIGGKGRSPCAFTPTFVRNGDEYYCTRHANPNMILASDVTLAKLSKKGLEALSAQYPEYWATYCAARETKIPTKMAFIRHIQCAIKPFIMHPLKTQEAVDAAQLMPCNDIPMPAIAAQLVAQFIPIIRPYAITHVRIESQLNARMKSIQDMVMMAIMTLFSPVPEFWYINAQLKLKDAVMAGGESCEVDTYDQRKKAGVRIVDEIVHSQYSSYLEYWSAHNKQDDLADCLLQGLRSEEKHI
jgi:hypothetical protein